MPYKRTFNPTGGRRPVFVNENGAEIDREWARIQAEKDTVKEEHLCAKCKTPGFGKSAIPCPNEPKGTR